MSIEAPPIESRLAAALRDGGVAWTDEWAPSDVVEAILYHGIAGLLVEKAGSMPGWPEDVAARVRSQAVAQAMWELRHRALLQDLLAAFADAGITALLLKGTAVAYDVYDEPSARSRGDSDLLIAERDLPRARPILAGLGYRPQSDGASKSTLQQAWSLSFEDGSHHHVDLHWQVMNSPALKAVLPFAECAAGAIALPRLSPAARGLDRVRSLIHTCLHRAMHITAPYFVGSRTYYGGDRLIWTYDIHVLASALSETEWRQLCALSAKYGAAAVCLDGLATARELLGTPIPDHVRTALGHAPRNEKASHYLIRSRQLGRAWQDLLAVPGVRAKLAYLKSRLLPSAGFVEAKYKHSAKRPLLHLYARRMLEFLRTRPRGQG